MVELGDRPHQAHVALLDQVQQRHPAALVLLGDGDDQAQVGLRHPVAGGLGAGLDLLGELDLLLLSQQRAPADLAQVRAERVRIGVALGRLGRLARALLDLAEHVSDLRRMLLTFVKPQ